MLKYNPIIFPSMASSFPFDLKALAAFVSCGRLILSDLKAQQVGLVSTWMETTEEHQEPV